MEGCTSMWLTDSLGTVMLKDHISLPLVSWCNVLQALHEDNWYQVQAKPQGEVHRPQVGDQKEEVPLCAACWILSDLLSTYGPVLSPHYGILRAWHKIVDLRMSPETEIYCRQSLDVTESHVQLLTSLNHV